MEESEMWSEEWFLAQLHWLDGMGKTSFAEKVEYTKHCNNTMGEVLSDPTLTLNRIDNRLRILKQLIGTAFPLT